MRVAAAQLNTTGDRDRNLEVAERLVRGAAAAGAELIGLPERWNLIDSGERLAAEAETIEGPAISAARAWARELGVNVLAGSITAQVEDDERPANLSLLIDRDGEIVASYRKIHMFDVDVGGVSYRESEHEEPGAEVVVGEVDGVEVGMTVCYDLRFPELHRILALRGARLIAAPSAFTVPTGRDHWEVLLRARAIENQLFVLAPAQIGKAPPHYESYGRSMVVDPWGVILATAPDEECFVTADLDLESIARIRERIPALANRCPSAYAWPREVGVP